MSTAIIFRKSANTNAFGLRGYWYVNTDTNTVHSFASSHDWPNPHHTTSEAIRQHSCELHREELTDATPKQRKDFIDWVQHDIKELQA